MSLNELLILPLPILADLHFQTSQFIYRNRKILKAASSFQLLPQCRSLVRVTNPCCNVVLETMPVKLHGRSHPVHKACKDGLPYGIRASLDPPCSYSPTFSSACAAVDCPRLMPRLPGGRSSAFPGTTRSLPRPHWAVP